MQNNCHSFSVIKLDREDILNVYDEDTLPDTIKTQILSELPEDYVFLNYKYTIQNTLLYTYHRDVTSSQSFQHLKHPSYTLILYLYDGNFINICPGSNDTIFPTKPYVISGEYGTCVLFNSDCVHAANIDHIGERLCIQYKICHKDDVDKLEHLQGKIISKVNKSVNHYMFFDYYILQFMSLLSFITIPLFDIESIGKFIERRQNNPLVDILSSFTGIQFYNN